MTAILVVHPRGGVIQSRPGGTDGLRRQERGARPFSCDVHASVGTHERADQPHRTPMRIISPLIYLACVGALFVAGCAKPTHPDTPQLQWIH
jgi:hypothetical protein